MSRTRHFGRWSRAFTVAVSSAVASVACGDGDPTSVYEAEGTSATPAGVFPGFPELHGEYPANCAGLTRRLRDCGVLSEGEAKCDDPTEPASQCVFECMAEASCALLANFNCGGSAPALSYCAAQCQYAPCNDGYSIPVSFFCDAEADCLDGSDELDCGYFVCADGSTVVESRVCNGFRECPDGSDEHGCPGFDCPERRIPLAWQCDVGADCSDGSDEVGCTYFVCEFDGTELPLAWQCDLEQDCLDGSDEFGCAELICR